MSEGIFHRKLSAPKVSVDAEYIEEKNDGDWIIWRVLNFTYKNDQGEEILYTRSKVASFLRREVAVEWLKANGYEVPPRSAEELVNKVLSESSSESS